MFLTKEYKNKVIIYLDILGIKSFTKKAGDDDLFEVYSRLESIRKFCLERKNLERFPQQEWACSGVVAWLNQVLNFFNR